ncbi:MAG: PAS domain S-box protein [Cyanobacteria bacterium J007]|nr:MAG: PAS domain S-box protein [Cyanobacteria bacterium J007]
MKNLRLLLVASELSTYNAIRQLLPKIELFSVELGWVRSDRAMREKWLGREEIDIYLIAATLGEAHDYWSLLSLPGREGAIAPGVVVVVETASQGRALLSRGAADYLAIDELSAPVLERSLRLGMSARVTGDRRSRTPVVRDRSSVGVREASPQENRARRPISAGVGDGRSNLKQSWPPLHWFKPRDREGYLLSQQSASELLREHSLTEDMFDRAAFGLFILDDSFRVVWMNRTLEQFFGLPREAAIGRDKRRLIRDRIAHIFENGAAFAEKVFKTYSDNSYIEQFECHVLPGENRAERWLQHWSQPIAEGLYAGGRIEYYTDITACKRAEAQLRASQCFVDRMTQALPNIVYIYDLDARRNIYSNHRILDVLGYTPEQIQAGGEQWIWDTVHPDDRPMLLDLHQRCLQLKDGEVLENKIRYKHANGQYRTLICRSVVFARDESGRPTQVLGSAEDLTEQQSIATQLWESESRLQTIVNNTSDGIAIVDLRGKIRFINPAAARLFGRGLDKMVDLEFGIPISEGVCEIGILRDRGEVCMTEMTVARTEWSGESVSIVCLRDISERHRAETALRESEERFRQLADNLQSVFWLMSPNWDTLFYLSPAYEKIWGRSLAALYERPERWVESVHPDDLHLLSDLIAEHWLGRSTICEYRIVRPDGEIRWILARTVPIADERGEITQVAGIAEDITDRKQAERQLKYRLSLETVLADISRELATSEAVDFVDLFRRLGEVMGADRVELQQQVHGGESLRVASWQNSSSPQDDSALAESATPAVASEEVRDKLLVPIRDRLGRMWGEIGVYHRRNHWQAWSEEDSQLLRVLGDTIYTYDARRQTQEQLRASEELYAGIFQHSAARIFLLKLSGEGHWVYETVNEVDEKAIGSSVKALQGKRPRAVLPKDVAMILERNCRVCQERGTPTTYEETLTTSGKLQMWRTTLVPIRDRSGAIVQVQGSSYDVTEEKQAIAEQLRQTRYYHLLSSLSLKIRQSLQIEEILAIAVRELQHTLHGDRVVFYRIEEDESASVLHEAIRPGWPAMLGNAKLTPQWISQYLRRASDRGIYACSDIATAPLLPAHRNLLDRYRVRAYIVVPILLNPLPGSESEISEDSGPTTYLWGLLCVHQCEQTREWTTFEIELLQQLGNQLSIALYQAQLLAHEIRQRQELTRSNSELEQFAYIASHDLQEPLRTIASFTQLLARRYHDRLDAKAERYINHIVDGSLRMQTLIEDLLQYSRVRTRAKPFEEIETDKVLEIALANLQSAIESNEATISVSALPVVKGDRAQLVQLFQNLIGNAIKYRRQDPPEIAIDAKREGDRYRFCIEDNGIGIDPKHRDRIFQIFQRLHTIQEYPGTGIGLAVCQKIVQRHGGCIWVESELGRGSKFYFTLAVPSI